MMGGGSLHGHVVPDLAVGTVLWSSGVENRGDGDEDAEW
jgi:hypothetical protein